VSAYEAIAAQFDDQTEEFVGNYSLFVVPANPEEPLASELIDSLHSSPVIEYANPVTQFHHSFQPVVESSAQEDAKRRGFGRMRPTVVGTSATEPRYPLREGRWLRPDSGDEAVVSRGICEGLGLSLGDAFEFQTASTESLRLTVVGITEQVDDVEFAMTRTKGGAPGGTNRGPASLPIYVPLKTVPQLTGEPPHINLVELRIHTGATIQQLEQAVDFSAQGAGLLRPEDVRAKIAGGFAAEGARKQAVFVTALSILASAFIIFTTLSMGVNERDTAVRQDNVSLIGIHPESAFGGSEPLFQLRFIRGNREEALAKLREGHHCLVPESFTEIAGLGVGDKLAIIPPKNPDHPVEYTIAGVVSMPGSNWITKTTGIRRHFVRTGGIVFAPEAQVRADFDLPDLEFVWMEREGDTTTETLHASLASLIRTAAENSPLPRSSGSLSRPAEGGVKVTSLRDVRSQMRQRGGDAIAAMGWLPLVTLVVVSLGIVNTIAASVRARRWEFGILRAVGLRRWSLTRLVISEAILIGLVASILSLLFGLLVGWTCLGLVGYVSNQWFEGVHTPLVFPWSALIFGYALTFVLCFLASLWPAIASGRPEPLTLLQAGRSAS
ncbi:MAG: ABC transporter permease, partial [Pirellulaceae bacterium]